MNKPDLGSDIGVGLGFTLMGIFVINVHTSFGVVLVIPLEVIGIGLSILGVAGMLISVSKKDGSDFFKDLGVAILFFVPAFLTYIFSPFFWLKIVSAFLTAITLIFVGMAMGRSLFKEDGSFRMDFRALPRLIVILLTTSAAVLSALSSLSDNNLFRILLNHF